MDKHTSQQTSHEDGIYCLTWNLDNFWMNKSKVGVERLLIFFKVDFYVMKVESKLTSR